ncbi:protoporphyrinogen/coproporphyrinogen oxidase [Microbacterium album]|uniref:Protoporphyrinogen oxidase n=1 Tax=Microbacterium album TaxID=2053191 RepID=A0A917MN07_9MICO|nr:FAD-dependent oxidoreductase [Microbacterium album]GGH50206.1 protoporphyrinogen oxidase [Microbacterium album]
MDLGHLYEQASATHVVVIGGGIAGLVAARECAKVGMRVTVLEAGEEPGGAIRTGEIAGIRLDLGAESFATRGGHVRRLVDELGLGDAVVTPGAGGAWVAGLPGRGEGGGSAAAPLPRGGILGIPANPFAEDVRRVIGWRGAWRAYLDRVRPPLTIGHEHSLGRLVRSRLGEAVLERLVAPVTTGVYSARPDDIDTDIAAPGLNAALTRAGSLTGAVVELAAARRGAPGTAVEGIDGGMGRLVDALAADLSERGVVLRTGTRVTGLRREGEAWVVELDADGADGSEVAERPAAAEGIPASADAPAPEGAPVSGEDPADGDGARADTADVVIVATDEGTARGLLAAHVPGLDERPARPGPVVHVVTLVLQAPALDAAPRGTGVLTVPGSHRAKALTHATAKWEWLRRDAQGRHVVRVSFGAQGEEPATEGLDEPDATRLALTEASALLGVPLTPEQLVGCRIERFTQSQPAATIGLREETRRVRERIRAVPALGVVGAWLAGTGLAQVVPDAVEEADRVRRAALWSDPEAPGSDPAP